MLMATENDIDLEGLMANPTQLVETERQYNIKLKEFSKFCNTEWDPAV